MNEETGAKKTVPTDASHRSAASVTLVSVVRPATPDVRFRYPFPVRTRWKPRSDQRRNSVQVMVRSRLLRPSGLLIRTLYPYSDGVSSIPGSARVRRRSPRTNQDVWTQRNGDCTVNGTMNKPERRFSQARSRHVLCSRPTIHAPTQHPGRVAGRSMIA
jgi:hypothetical protein